jgi:hypothetical protein
MHPVTRGTIILCGTALIGACAASPDHPLAVRDGLASGAHLSDWSTPMSIGAPINVPGITESNPVISADELSLYFDSDRTDLGTEGARDIFVARRACRDCPWQTPINLGGTINTSYVDGSPALSDDGHFLFFISHAPTTDCAVDPTHPPADPTRPCLEDIYVSVRKDPKDDLGWSVPVRLGSAVNGPGAEGEPEFQRNADEGGTNLYFTRVTIPGSPNSRAIFRVGIRLRGVGADGAPDVELTGSAEPVPELDLLNVGEFGMTMRSDGKELYYYVSAAPGGVGALDLMVTTRQNAHAAWSTPVNVGIPLNSIRADEAPSISHDGRTLYFASARQGPPSRDIWVVRRTVGGE